MIPRACLDCGRPARASLCQPCAVRRHANYGAEWRRLRAAVLQRDQYVCHWCGGRATTADHVVPLVAGGARLDPDNVVAACARCNFGRTSNVRR